MSVIVIRFVSSRRTVCIVVTMLLLKSEAATSPETLDAVVGTPGRAKATEKVW